MVNIQGLPNEILVNICEQLDGINTRPEVNSTDGSKKSLPGLQEFRLASRRMNGIGKYVMFQKVTLWPDHKSWKDLNSIAADPTLSGAVRYLMLENVAPVKSSPHVNNEQQEKEQEEAGKFDEVDLSLFPNLVQVMTNHWSAFRKQTAAPLFAAILNTKVHKSQIYVLRVFGTGRCYSMLSRRLCCSLVKLSKLFPPKKQSRSRPLLTHITLGVLFGVVSFGRAHEVFESHMPMPTMQFIVHLIILQLMALGPHR